MEAGFSRPGKAWRIGFSRPRSIALWLRLGPLPDGLLDDTGTSTLVVDRNGEPLYEALSGDGTRSVRLTADSLPPMLVAATVAAEDHRFWSHPGVDPVAMLRALKTNLAERSVVEGGSTISQQAAKLLLNRRQPARTRGWTAKIKEAVIALRLEHRFTKREILAIYLNLAAYGNQIAGVERASRAYFGTTSSMLTPAQAAFLAGLPQRPSRFNPWRSRDLAVSRQRAVLKRMEAAGSLTAAQAAEARDETLTLSPAAVPFGAPHFVEMVLAAAGDVRADRIQTTIDGALQAEVAGVIESHRSALQRHGAGNVAVVVLDNASGEWLAWEGSGNYADAARGGAINGAIAPRQPGSALKPFTYALAFEEGFTPASVLADVPSSFRTAEEGVVYSPRNYDGRFRGPLLARAALAGSENVPAVALASEVGVPKLLRFLTRAGLTTFEQTAAHYGLGLTLGNAEVRLDELTAAYSAFARGGEWIQPTWLLRNTRDGEARRIVSQRTAFWITDILADAEAREYVFGRGGSLEFPFPVAVKTGTSQAVPRQLDRRVFQARHRRRLGWQLRSHAAQEFERCHRRGADLPRCDAGGRTARCRRRHGTRWRTDRRRRRQFGRAGDLQPVRPLCQRLVPHAPTGMDCCGASAAAVQLASHVGRGVADGLAAGVSGVGGRLRAPRFGSARVRGCRGCEGCEGCEACEGVRARVRAVQLSIVSPAAGATYLIDPTLRTEFQTLSLRAVSATRGRIEWRVNGRAVGAADSDRKVDWPLSPGRHEIVARDEAGRTAAAHIVVR